MMFRYLAAISLTLWALNANAFELKVEQVTERTYALVGDIGPRTAENHALNNTLGFLVTDGGVLLVGSGATPAGARLIERTIASVTDQPIRWVVNIGAQDHHWLGNDYFVDQGAEVIALRRTVAAQKAHVGNHLTRLKQIMGEADGVQPVFAPKPIDADSVTLTLGGVDVQLIWPGNGHFPGDAVLWYAQERVAFAGDFVFNDRILGVHPFTPLAEWRDAFHAIAALKPAHVVPGHGHPGDLAKATRETGDYLDWLVTNVGQALADWVELDAAVEELADAPDFRHLQFFDAWHRRNVHQAYVQFEAAQY